MQSLGSACGLRAVAGGSPDTRLSLATTRDIRAPIRLFGKLPKRTRQRPMLPRLPLSPSLNFAAFLLDSIVVARAKSITMKLAGSIEDDAAPENDGHCSSTSRR